MPLIVTYLFLIVCWGYSIYTLYNIVMVTIIFNIRSIDGKIKWLSKQKNCKS